MLGSCYQVIEGYEKANKYYNRVEELINYSSHELFKKLVFLLDIKDESADIQKKVADILPLIEKRKIPIKESIITANDNGINGINKTAQIKQQLFNGPMITFELSRDVLFLKEDGGETNEC